MNLLEQVDAITTTATGTLCWADRDTTPDHAVALAVELAEAHQEMARSRVDMVRGYAETTGCRRQHLLGYFGEEHDSLCEACDNCDNCDRGDRAPVERPDPRAAHDFAPHSRVRHAEWGDGIVMSLEHDRVTVVFDSVGYRTLSLRAVRDNDLLTATR